MDSLRKWRTAALRTIAVLVAAGSLAAFAESYRGLFDWSREHGLSGIWAAAWPLQLDVFIAIGELALFVGLVDGWSKRARAAGWSVTLIGAAVSTAGNVGHVATHDIASRLSAGVPPIAATAALAVALGILKRVAAMSRSAPEVQPASAPADTPAPVPDAPASRQPVTPPAASRPKPQRRAEAVTRNAGAARRAKRHRMHKADDHSLCLAENCPDAKRDTVTLSPEVGLVTASANGNGVHP